MAIMSFTTVKGPLPRAKIDLQMFSVITAVKNGTIAVKRYMVFLAVQVVAKQERPATRRKTGIKMLEKPYTVKIIFPIKKKKLLCPGPP